MGTNYYLHKASKSKCEHCGHDPEAEVLHIGKSSYGWCFSLHVIPEEGINSLEDWVARWGEPGVQIRNEYEEEMPPEEMYKIITTRGPGKWCHEGRELHRHDLDSWNTVAHGPGSWDLIRGEFS